MSNQVVTAPEYVTSESKDREEFLSQHGNFTPGERELFHFLCSSWQPVMPYERVSSGANLGLGNKKGEFLSLMAKLTKARVGLLRTAVEDGQRRESAVILTSEGNRRFYNFLLLEEGDRLAEEIPGMPPMERLLQKRGVQIPDRYIRDFSYDEILATVDGKIGHPDSVLRLPAAGDEHVLVSPEELREFPARMRQALRELVADQSLLTAIAKSCESSVGKLRSVLDSDNAKAWAGLTKCLFDGRTTLETTEGLLVPRALYATAAVVHRLSLSRVSADRDRVKQEKERLQNLEVIAVEVRGHPRKALERSELDKVLEEYRSRYGSDFDSFRDEFYTRFTVPKERRNLATIQPLGQHYVHRDNLYRLFLDRFQDLQAELYTYYLSVMAEFLRGRGGEELFASYQTFSQDIGDRITKIDSTMGALFSKPFLLAEVIVYGEKKRRNVSSIDEVRTILARFFVSDQMEMRDFASIFELSIVELFETSFIQMPLLLQVWFRITGKYESFKETLTRRSGARRRGYRDAGDASSAASQAASRRDQQSGDAAVRGGVSGRGRSASVRSRTRGSGVGGHDTKKAKYYTKRDQEKAWQEFGNALKH